MLSDTIIRAVKPRDRPYKLSDELGLFLLVTPRGGRWWRFKFRFDRKEQLLSLGVYPEVSLAQARKKRDSMRRDCKRGINPAAKRRAEKYSAGNSFEAIAREWFGKFSANWEESHSSKIIRRLELYIFPWIGARPIAKLGARDVLTCLQRVEAGAKLETAKRALQNCSRIFRYAIATGRADENPATHLMGALAPLVFVRPGELRAAEWSEMDFFKAEWHIPAMKMKMPTKHIVPLSRQAVSVLRDIHPLTGAGGYVFPSPRSSQRQLSAVALLAALRRMGYEQGTVTVHGFRSTASTLLNEQGKNRDWIERQLAHGERDGVRAAYNYADYLPQRKIMMQEWADYLDGLKKSRFVAGFGEAVQAEMDWG